MPQAIKLELDEDGFETGSISKVLTEDVKQRLKECFTGYDIDETMVRLGLMNLMMHGIDNPNINNKDTLSKNFSDPNPYSIIMANPPFTGNLDAGDLFENRRTDTKKTELLLKDWLKIPFTVKEHLCGIRPATLERRPFVGIHPQNPGIGILNGMGTKGCSLAPYFAKQLVDNLVRNKPINPDASVERFSKILSRNI